MKMNLQKGLVGHWTLDSAETSNGTAYDSSAYDNHGNIINTVSTGESSIIGESYDFNIDGSNGYVFEDNLSVSSSEITISLWAKIETTDGSNYMFDTQSPRLPLIKWNDEDTSALTWGMGDNYITYTQGNRVGEWVHYVLLSDGTTERLYVDSTEVDSQSQVTSTIDLDELYIGEYNNLGYSANGNISDFRIYDRALSDSEISALYNMRSQRQIESSLQEGLVVHWTMDSEDFSSDSISDRSANGVNGIVQSGSPSISDGIIQDSLNFNGSDDYIISNDGISISPPMSISCWINLDGQGGPSYNTFINVDDVAQGSGGRFGLYWDSDDTRYGCTLSGDQVLIYEDPKLNEWILLTAVSNSNGDVTLYENAISQVTVSNTATSLEDCLVSISARTDASVDNRVNGRIDDARIYDRALSESEINALYNKR